MTGEPVNIFRHYELYPVAGCVDAANLQYLHIVSHHIRSHLEGTHVNDIYVRVLHCKNSAELRVLTL